MRGASTGIAGFISILAMIIAVPTLWATMHIVSEDGFTASADKAASKPEVQNFFAQEIGNEIAQQTDIPIAGALSARLAQQYARSDAFRTDFSEIARQQHEWLFNPPAPGASLHTMELNLTPMVNRVLSDSPVPVQLDHDLSVPVEQDSVTAGGFEDTGKIVNIASWVSLVVAIVSGLIALFASSRRFITLAWLGFGAVLAGGISVALAYALPKLVVGSDVAGDPLTAEHTLDVVLRGVLSTLTTASVVVVIVGAVVLVAGLLGHAIARR